MRPAKDGYTAHVRLPGFELRAGAHAAGSMLPAHAHDDPTLCYVLEGRFTEYARGRALDCEADTLKLTAAGEVHSDRFPHASRGVRIDIDRARFTGVPEIDRLLDGEFMLARSRMRPLLHRLLAELDASDAAAPLVMEGLLLELLAHLARERIVAQSGAGARDVPAWLRQAEAVIRERFTTPLTLSGVAAEVGVNASTLARAYRARFRISVGAQVRRLRIEWAAEALRTTEERTSIIALRAGFYDQAHFSNVFRAVMGVSPAGYRRSWR